MQRHSEAMAPTAVHPQPAVAGDGARAFVHAAGSSHSDGFAARVLSRLGSEAYGHFADTRHRLLVALVETGGDRLASDVEEQKWRLRLAELLRTRPELTEAVLELTADTRRF